MIAASLSRRRWYILALLFFATTINYLDRIVFAVLMPIMREQLHFGTEQYGFITGAFQITYTVGFLAMGKFVDRYGTRIGYAVSLTWWSVSAALHSLATTPVSLGAFRALLGFGEAGNFPSAIKAVAEWFPPKDRAFATGIFNAGSNVASMIGPPVFAYLVMRVGWRTCFLLTPALCLVWLALWLTGYRNVPTDDTAADQRKVGWSEALTYPATWGFAIAKFFTDPVWWFYLYWLPPYFYDVRKFDLKQIGWALPVIYLMADIGSVAGGWLSGYFMRLGWPQRNARMTALAIFASLMPIAALSVLVANPIYAIALVSLATSAHQGWSANLYTTVSDSFPKSAVASVTGIGGCLGGLGGFLFSAIIPGYVVQHFGYSPVFLTMGCFHLTALAFLVWSGRQKRRGGEPLVVAQQGA